MEKRSMNYAGLLFMLGAILGTVLLLSGCGSAVIVVTATPSDNVPSLTPAATSTPMPTFQPSPTAEIWNDHQRCAASGSECLVNGNSNPRFQQPFTSESIAGRNVTMPAGWQFIYSGAVFGGDPLPPPFVYCGDQFAGCQYEFHHTAGAWTLADTISTMMYRDTVYLLTVDYTVMAPGCAGRLDLANARLKARLFDAETGREITLAQASIYSWRTSTFSEWAVKVTSANVMDVLTRITFEVDYPACQSDAKVFWHGITWRAVMPEDIGSYQEI